MVRKPVHLSIAALEGDVAQSLLLGQLPGPLDGGSGQVDPEHGATHGEPSRLPSRPPCPTPDVDHVLLGPDPPGPAKDRVVQPKLRVVVDHQPRHPFEAPAPPRRQAGEPSDPKATPTRGSQRNRGRQRPQRCQAREPFRGPGGRSPE
jgi:hypothetical protein